RTECRCGRKTAGLRRDGGDTPACARRKTRAHQTRYVHRDCGLQRGTSDVRRLPWIRSSRAIVPGSHLLELERGKAEFRAAEEIGQELARGQISPRADHQDLLRLNGDRRSRFETRTVSNDFEFARSLQASLSH